MSIKDSHFSSEEGPQGITAICVHTLNDTSTIFPWRQSLEHSLCDNQHLHLMDGFWLPLTPPGSGGRTWPLTHPFHPSGWKCAHCMADFGGDEGSLHPGKARRGAERLLS